MLRKLALLLASISAPSIAWSQSIAVHLEVTDLDDNPVSAVAQSSLFKLRVLVEDIRPTPQGVFAAYLDVTYPGALVLPIGSLVNSSTYPNAASGIAANGVIDEAGGFDGISPLGPGRFLLVEQTFQPAALGRIDFASDPPEGGENNVFLLFGENFDIPFDQVVFGTASVDVFAAPEVVFSDSFEVVSRL